MEKTSNRRNRNGSYAIWSEFGVPHPDRTADHGKFQAPERELENFSEGYKVSVKMNKF